MKILLISPLPPPYGGIANWSKLMLNFAENTEDEFDIINIAPKKRATEGRNLFDRIVVSGLDMIRRVYELRKKLKTNRPDVIHMTTSGSLAIIRDYLLLKTAKKYGVPTVYHIHFGKTEEMSNSGSRMWKLFSKTMEIATRVVAIDNKTYTVIKKLVPNASVDLVSNPINISELPMASEKPKKQVVFIGWVVPTKGMGELVAAWNTVGNEYPDYELLIIGQSKPEYLEELKNTMKVKNITFMGELQHDKAMEILAESSLFILPSYTEGCPYSVMEAMALNTTVIATDVGAIPEMLSNDCGIVIKPKSVEDIVLAFRMALSDRKMSMRFAENALSKAKSLYSIEKVYDKYKCIWEMLVMH